MTNLAVGITRKSPETTAESAMLPQFMDSFRLILSGPVASDLAVLPAELLAPGLRGPADDRRSEDQALE
jgi:hypothetical protein